MSNTRRSSESSIPLAAKASEKGFFHYYMKAIFTGLMVGPVSSTLTFPVDKIAFAYQTMHGHASPSFSLALSTAFRKPFSGYFPGIVNASLKNIFMFPAKAFFEQRLQEINPDSAFNPKLAGFFAGILTVYVTSPVSVIKALRYNNQPVSQIRELDWKALFRRVHSTALRDGVQFGAFFGMLPIISSVVPNPLLAGSLAGFFGAIFSNPLSVIANNQKLNGSRLIPEAVSLCREGGLARFYRGFFKTTALRMGIQGAATGVVIEAAEKIYDHMKQHQESKGMKVKRS
ncbi:hypothetical protein AQUSIP_14160 [Aquicella siphonis]|uniref:Mitochondrial carrier protein n=1 Tax=Aquicella siphonis TaxID=254247 RepID=A0A5E4PID0_9COXI|nr:hypothetical protein [Aquicella siphonis]VVC76111.1 hypothetical protein AQUSIP_14160 [Aquicella siphonis]